MRALHILVLVLAFLMLFTAALGPAISGSQEPNRACAAPTLLESDASYVICCCRTFTGLCCAEVAFCSGFVPGCFCTG
jgi:hypothetical protein